MIKLPFSRSISSTINNYRYTRKFEAECKRDKWTFSPYRKAMIRTETPDWEQNYLPINVKDKVVLDVGAGEGETAKFYLQHGAKKVIAVEPYEGCHWNLFENTKNHKIISMPTYFRPEILKLPFDFAKIDIEGYEEQLLYLESPLPNVPMVVEVHGLQQIPKFHAKGFRIKEGYNPFGCVAYAYWKC